MWHSIYLNPLPTNTFLSLLNEGVWSKVQSLWWGKQAWWQTGLHQSLCLTHYVLKGITPHPSTWGTTSTWVTKENIHAISVKYLLLLLARGVENSHVPNSHSWISDMHKKILLNKATVKHKSFTAAEVPSEGQVTGSSKQTCIFTAGKAKPQVSSDAKWAQLDDVILRAHT